eukprot:2207321-Pyramimonas_sp.AAC.1
MCRLMCVLPLLVNDGTQTEGLPEEEKAGSVLINVTGQVGFRLQLIVRERCYPSEKYREQISTGARPSTSSKFVGQVEPSSPSKAGECDPSLPPHASQGQGTPFCPLRLEGVTLHNPPIQVKVEACKFSKNRIKHAQRGAGGAVYIANGLVIVNHTVWMNNSVESLVARGGALFSAAGSLSLANCTFQGLCISYLQYSLPSALQGRRCLA